MKVSIGGRTYYAETEPIVLILSDSDKRDITNMDPACSTIGFFPDTDEWEDDEKCRAFLDAEENEE